MTNQQQTDSEKTLSLKVSTISLLFLQTKTGRKTSLTTEVSFLNMTFTTQCYASRVHAVIVCLSHTSIVSK